MARQPDARHAGRLVEAAAGARQQEADAGGDVGAGPDGGRVRTGAETSDSLKYSREVTSPDQDPGEERSDGQQSNFSRLESPDREDG